VVREKGYNEKRGRAETFGGAGAQSKGISISFKQGCAQNINTDDSISIWQQMKETEQKRQYQV